LEDRKTDPSLLFSTPEAERRSLFAKKTVRDVNVSGKRTLVRVDFNVPEDDQGNVLDNTRIEATLPTIDYLINHQAKVILVSHLGRPGGKFDRRYCLDSVARELSKLISKPVKKMDKTVTSEVSQAVSEMKNGEVLLLENVRFNPGELSNDQEFAKKLAGLADIFVNDAFGTAHRKHASVVGIAEYLPTVSGFLLEKEVSTLTSLIKNPAHPFIAILGGNKISDKIGVIDRFLDIVDGILTGGGMCFTFLRAKGMSVGKSLLEANQLELAAKMLKKAERNGVSFYLPADVVAAEQISSQAKAIVTTVDKFPSNLMGLDIGPSTIEIYRQVIARARTIFWNGPLGVFEIDSFAQGTKEIAQAIANQTKHGAVSIIGGGDSDAALKKFDLEDQVSFVSTGGGASLKVLEGTSLPGVEVIADK
jgi:phosphoglycerate kinase